MTNKIKLNSLQKFLIWCAGADHEILARKSCLTERYKYESIGTTVILTAIMAFFSGGYALFTVFGSIPISIILGSVWSCIILNLDRSFILTANQGKSDSKWKFLPPILRLIIAILLGLVVAKPLELRLFEGEINQEIKQRKIEQERKERKTQQEQFENTPESKRINEINAEIQGLTKDRKQVFDNSQKASLDVIDEEEGKGKSQKHGQGNIYKAKKEREQELKQEVKDLDNKIQKLEKEKTSLTNDQKSKFSKINSTLSQQTDRKGQTGSLLDRISALERLSNKDASDPSDTSIWWTNLLITALFIIIEISPILVKMLSKDGLYEKLLEIEKKDRMERENLDKIQEIEILKLEKLKEIELRVEALKIEYFRLKERNKEKMENTGNDIKNIQEHYDQDIEKFRKLCRKLIEDYESLADKV